MSYILDALRKADAQREGDPARGIHAQPVAPLDAGTRRPGMAAWAAVAAGVLLAAAAGYLFGGRDAPQLRASAGAVTPMPAAAAPPPARVLQVAAATVQPAPPAMPAPGLAPAPAPARVLAVAPSALVPAPAPARAAAAAAVAPPALAVAPLALAAVAPPAVIKVPLPAARTGAPQPAQAAAPRAEEPARILQQAELPAEVQRELPRLAISGGVHSEDAAQRMLIVGGQVVNEGAELAPGLVLEQIRARAAVLRFKGYRYSVGF